MSHVHVPPSEFCALGFTIIGNANVLSVPNFIRRYKALFGVSPLLASTLWDLLSLHVPSKEMLLHLFWALLRLNTYATDRVCVALVKVNLNTFRKWSWALVCALAELNRVYLDIILPHFIYLLILVFLSLSTFTLPI